MERLFEETGPSMSRANGDWQGEGGLGKGRKRGWRREKEARERWKDGKASTEDRLRPHFFVNNRRRPISLSMQRSSWDVLSWMKVPIL